ncbi:DUF4190 domain-containing protein [Kitasatospora sp. NBC_00240]|uniref:DUF4190 domain-containing protein n=1 Tax=Kitasatospora sp. NBC_00240 TaxID=2903567 RepID=UPI002253712E|nr:DUF4190 domain-containing protein [Kitasatospora sp. NBC_00240]MCX5211003.1 DUF4190 domain-containing protein [Kitasatospora sp. NBC_00240]
MSKAEPGSPEDGPADPAAPAPTAAVPQDEAPQVESSPVRPAPIGTPQDEAPPAAGIPAPAGPPPGALRPDEQFPPAAPEPFDPWAPPGAAEAAALLAAGQAGPAVPPPAGWGAPPAGRTAPPAGWAPPATGWGAVTPGAVSGYQGMYAYPPRPTNGLAIGSLVTALTCMSPVALVLGVIALVQIHKRQERGRGMAVAGVVLAVLGLLLGALAVLGVASEDADGALPIRPAGPPGSVTWDKVAKGDCYNPAPGSGDAGRQVSWVTKVPCSLPHHSEAAGTAPIAAAEGGGYPGEDKILKTADTLCKPVFDSYVLDDWAVPDGVGLSYMYPTRGSWRASGGSLICVLEDVDVPHKGSLRTDRTTLTAAQLAYLEAVKPLNAAAEDIPEDEVADAPADYRAWAATMATATRQEGEKLAVIAWPEGAKAPGEAMVASKPAAVEAWHAVTTARDGADLTRALQRAKALLRDSVGEAKAVRAALGLSTGEHPGDLQV